MLRQEEGRALLAIFIHLIIHSANLELLARATHCSKCWWLCWQRTGMVG